MDPLSALVQLRETGFAAFRHCPGALRVARVFGFVQETNYGATFKVKSR